MNSIKIFRQKRIIESCQHKFSHTAKANEQEGTQTRIIHQQSHDR